MPNQWSASNSTGTTDMGIWGSDSSSGPETKKAEKLSIYAEKRGNLNSLPTYRYPIYIDNLNGANDTPMVQECIHFTAVKQGGLSLQAEADNSHSVAKAEQEKWSVSNST